MSVPIQFMIFIEFNQMHYEERRLPCAFIHPPSFAKSSNRADTIIAPSSVPRPKSNANQNSSELICWQTTLRLVFQPPRRPHTKNSYMGVNHDAL
jgi:hypothetical protein